MVQPAHLAPIRRERPWHGMKLSVALSNDESAIGPESIVGQARPAEELDTPGCGCPIIFCRPSRTATSTGRVRGADAAVPYCRGDEPGHAGDDGDHRAAAGPVLLAKQLATLERLAPGRVVFGVGVGWDASEFDAVGVPFSQRGARTDETIDLVRTLHRGETPRENQFFGSAAGVFEPRPTAPLPIMVGGMTGPAFRRAARVADRWQAFGLSPQEFRTRREDLDRLSAPRRISAGIMLSREDSARSVADLVDFLHDYEEAGPTR